MPEEVERRKYARVILARPVPGKLGTAKVFVVDVSVTGAKLAHQGDLPVGTKETLSFDWKGDPITFDCEVVRTELDRPAREPGGKPVYGLGVRFRRAHGDSAIHLRILISEHVMRALDEQKANARGIPPIAATFQSGVKQSGYISLRLMQGEWKRFETRDPKQPIDGFTVSAKEDPAQIEMLCETYKSSDFNGRKMIRQMAELSIAAADAVPTRRYEP
jgi:hypothetical protein